MSFAGLRCGDRSDLPAQLAIESFLTAGLDAARLETWHGHKQ
jgi:hypothetical protein